MKSFSLAGICFGGLLSLPLLATATDYQVVPTGSQLNFHGTYQGAGFVGRFPQWTAIIRYDPQHLEQSSFDVSISLAGTTTGDSQRDQSLPGPDFFDTRRYPTAHFVTHAFRQQADGSVLADGVLELKGHRQPVVLKVRFQGDGAHAQLDVSTRLQRLDYGIGSGDYADTSVIGAAVEVTAHLQLSGR